MTLPHAASEDLQGSQRPRIFVAPKYHSSAGPDAVELAALAGLILDSWQEFVLLHALGEREDGKWAAPTVGLLCPRQNGKSALLEARELAGLFILHEEVIVHSSHEQATASEQFRRVLDLIDNTPELKKRMLKPIRGKGSEAIELRSGQRILFKTRTSGGLRGFSVPCLIFDEAYNLPEHAIAAMMPTTTAADNPQIWYTSSAVDQQQHDHGQSLARQRRRGIAGSPGLAFFEWSAEGDDPSKIDPLIAANPETWAIANPGLGIRQDVETLANIQATMGPRQFAVEHLGVGDWPTDNADANAVLTVQQWNSLLDPHSMMSSTGVIAFDVAPDFSSGSIAGAGYRDDGRVHVGIIDIRPRMSWLPKAIAELVTALRPTMVVADPGGGVVALLPELERLGVDVVTTKSKDYAQACMMFAEGANNGSVAHIGEPSLQNAIDAATTKPLADGWKWSRQTSGIGDISPLVAATLAHWGVVANTPKIPTVWNLADFEDEIRAEQQPQQQADDHPPDEPHKPRVIPFNELPGR
jgi:phage terminase large subunit-like protein